MNLLDYQIKASRTCPSLGSKELDLLHMDLGIATEIGEILDIFKKHIAYKKEIDVIHVGEELADTLWYVVNKARIENIKLNENIEEYQIHKYSTAEGDLAKICDTLIYFTLYHYNYGRIISILKYISNYFKLDFYKLLDNNINKLLARYPDKFEESKALNRDLVKERIELEK